MKQRQRRLAPRLRPHEEAIAASAARRDAALAAVYATPEWRAAQEAVRDAHASISAAPTAQARKQAEETYGAAVRVRDALSDPVHAAHEAEAREPAAALAAIGAEPDEPGDGDDVQ